MSWLISVRVDCCRHNQHGKEFINNIGCLWQIAWVTAHTLTFTLSAPSSSFVPLCFGTWLGESGVQRSKKSHKPPYAPFTNQLK